MLKTRFDLDWIPALLWGGPSDRLYVFVHGKLASKEAAAPFARVAVEKGCQVLSFDLARHGERTDSAPLDVFSGVRDLEAVAAYAFPRWAHVSLYACSLGAYFSLQAYADRPFERALFQSPIVDMAFLVRQMMRWFRVTEAELEARGTIDTPIDPLRWDYYRYILAHPTERWPIPTRILYGGRDEMQSLEIMRAFSDRFSCRLTVSPDSEHPFMAPEDERVTEAWLRDNI